MKDDRVLTRARTPEGRVVEIHFVTWDHVVHDDAHPEMDDHLFAVIETIEHPEHREVDPRLGRQRFFRRGGPEEWVRVVTEFSGNVDRLVTAFPQSNDPTP